jgi:transcription-repair coupling factor (superfamily II helicase)
MYLDLPASHIQSRERQTWTGLAGASRSLAIASAVRDKQDGLTLVITTDTETASQLEREIRFYLKQEQVNILRFPDWETLPYDTFSPHQDIVSERIATLYSLLFAKGGVLVLPVASLMNRLPPRSYIAANSLWIDPVAQRGADLPSPGLLRTMLDERGYHCVNTVYEHGEFAIRGSLLDVFPMGSSLPYRIDYFDQHIESIRTFDPETQRTIEKVSRISLLPAREFPLDAQGINRFCNQWHEVFPERDAKKCPVYQDVASGIAPAGIEYYLPLFFEESSHLLEYLPGQCEVFVCGDIHQTAQQHWQDVQGRFAEYGIDPYRPLLAPARAFVPVEEIFQRLKSYRQIQLRESSHGESRNPVDFAIQAVHDIGIEKTRHEFPLGKLKQLLEDKKDFICLFSVESAGRREALFDLLGKIGIAPKPLQGWHNLETLSPQAGNCYVVISPLSEGFMLDRPGKPRLLLVTETELFGKQVYQERRRASTVQASQDAIFKNLDELKSGMPVVHIDHGIGRYAGMVVLKVNEHEGEFILLEYTDNAKLYIPVSSLHLISRYSGADSDHAPLHRLGSDQWQKAKRKAAEQVRDVAAELLDIYARRAAREGFRFKDPEQDLSLFAAEFPFEETADQHEAIQAVFRDMVSGKPMDRLVCGDVGFGKTEVAMRAAFIAVHSQKQVAILVPTTLLAQQHYENFKDRFANWPVKIEAYSRFRTAEEQRVIAAQLANGKIDIVIGTHKLLQGNINFKQLGLLIIDEEHRFGVQQKERMKSLRSEVDILTLTATPIPRTLNMAMSGLREFSIIATPPARRLSVKTFVRQKEAAQVKEAILRELLRGGQVFYLHNDVQTIARTKEEIEQLVPEARVIVGHGQMRERQLEKVMVDFYHKRFNVLVCTTIIETGIDIPNANTIIIERADKFGLAQLHQLRGRVGRSHHQAYAYLLTPDRKAMTPDALKRLDAIEASDTLGSGFALATHDLEIRGAGELLGDSQSGQIQSIGFSLYMDMLERTVEAMRQGKIPNPEEGLRRGAEVDLHIPALIPEAYLPDPQDRLILYKRIASARSEKELDEFQVEMIDRFGLLPEACKNLFRITAIKLRLDQLGIKKLEANEKGGRMEFTTHTRVHPLTIVKMVQGQPQRYQMQGATHLKFSLASETAEKRFVVVGQLLESLLNGHQAA